MKFSIVQDFLLQGLTFCYRFCIHRRYYILLHDILISLLALPLTLRCLEGKEGLTHYSSEFIEKHVMVYAFLSTGIYVWVQIYRDVWRYFSWREMVNVSLSVIYVILLFSPLAYLMQEETSGLSVIVMGACGLMHLFLLSFSRIMVRLIQEQRPLETLFFGKRIVAETDEKSPAIHRIKQGRESSPARVLLVGMDKEMELYIRQNEQSPYHLYEIIGLIDEKPLRVGCFIYGVEVLGTVRNLNDIMKTLNQNHVLPDHIVFASSYLKRKKKLDLFYTLAKEYGIELNHLPPQYYLSKIIIPHAA